MYRTLLLAAGLLFPYVGSDAGYEVRDSEEPGGPVYSFQDISSTGTLLQSEWTWSSAQDDGVAGPLPLSFDFTWFGVPMNEIWVSSNGFLSFGDPGGSFYSNQTLPNSAVPGHIIAVFWDDLDENITAGGLNVYTEDLGDRFIVQWDSVAHFGYNDHVYTFQAILFQQSGGILLQYQTMSDEGNPASSGDLPAGASATVGIEGTSSEGLLYNYLNADPTISNTMYDGLAVGYLPTGAAAPWPVQGGSGGGGGGSVTPGDREGDNGDGNVFETICGSTSGRGSAWAMVVLLLLLGIAGTRKMKTLLALGLMLAVAGCAQTPPTWEGGVKVKGTKFVEMKDILSNPSAFENKWVRVEGTVDKVCKSRGCWVQIADGESVLMAKSGDHDVLLPTDCEGQRVIVVGTLVIDDHAKHEEKDCCPQPKVKLDMRGAELHKTE